MSIVSHNPYRPRDFDRKVEEVDEETARARLAKVYRRDAIRAAIFADFLDRDEGYRIIKNHEFGFVDTYFASATDPIDLALNALEHRGLCSLEALEGSTPELPMVALFVDNRIDMDEFSALCGDIVDRIEEFPDLDQVYPGSVADQVLQGEAYSRLRAISEEYLAGE